MTQTVSKEAREAQEYVYKINYIGVSDRASEIMNESRVLADANHALFTYGEAMAAAIEESNLLERIRAEDKIREAALVDGVKVNFAKFVVGSSQTRKTSLIASF